MTVSREWTAWVASYKRAGRVSTDLVVPNCRIVVPSSQMAEYREHPLRNGAELVEIPDEMDGNLSRKKNWIFDQAGASDFVVMDDDLSGIRRYEGGSPRSLDPEEVGDLFDQGFLLAKDLGVVQWGLNQQADPKFYREYTPFCFLSPILGPFSAFTSLPRSIRRDERLWLKEDYDLWLQIVYRFRKTLRLNQYHYQADHKQRKGGLTGKRTVSREVEEIQILTRKWGSRIVSYSRKDPVSSMKVRVPIPGV